MSNVIYLAVPVSATNINLASNVHVAGFPAMTSVEGFVHALERHLNTVDPDAVLTDWMFTVRNLTHLPGHRKFVRYRKNERSDLSRTFQSPTVNEQLGSINATVIIKMLTELTADDWQAARNNGQLDNAFGRLRFAGGTTTIYTRPFSEDREGRAIGFYPNVDGALNRLSKFDMVVEDKTALIDEARLDGETVLDTLCRLLERHPKSESQTPDDDYQGYLIPAAIGYQQIGERKVREGVRDGVSEHVYAEPVLGLVRLRTVASMLIQGEDNHFEDFYWSNNQLCPDSRFGRDLFFVSNPKFHTAEEA